MSTHRPELERVLVDVAVAATGQQLQRIWGHFDTSDVQPLVDTWAARDVGMRELKGGMSPDPGRAPDRGCDRGA